MQASHKREAHKDIIKQLDKKNQELLNKRKNNSNKIQYFEQEIELFKAKIELIKTVLGNYYISVLKKGDRIRKNGIVWIIHKLWRLKISVDENMLPDVLDKDSKIFLFKYAHTDNSYTGNFIIA